MLALFLRIIGYKFGKNNAVYLHASIIKELLGTKITECIMKGIEVLPNINNDDKYESSNL